MWHCIECGAFVAVDNRPGNEGLPASKYWAERDNVILTMPHMCDYVKVFCGAECSLTYHEKSCKTHEPSSTED